MEWDNLEHAILRKALARRVDAALERAAALDVGAMVPGERVHWEDGSFCFVQRYLPEPGAQKRFEAHRRYADLQWVISGRERILCAPLEGMEPEGPFDGEQDIGFYTGPSRTMDMVLGPGDYLVLAPWDAHMPSLAAGGDPEPVEKVIWKIPME